MLNDKHFILSSGVISSRFTCETPQHDTRCKDTNVVLLQSIICFLLVSLGFIADLSAQSITWVNFPNAYRNNGSLAYYDAGTGGTTCTNSGGYSITYQASPLTIANGSYNLWIEIENGTFTNSGQLILNPWGSATYPNYAPGTLIAQSSTISNGTKRQIKTNQTVTVTNGTYGFGFYGLNGGPALTLYRVGFEALAPTNTPTITTNASTGMVTLSANAGQSIYYRTDGLPITAANAATSNIYTSPFFVPVGTVTITRAVFVTAGNPGPSASSTFTSTVACTPPTISPTSGTFQPGYPITVTLNQPGGVNRYTTDGSTPNSTSPILSTSTISFSTAATLKVITTMDGYNPSSVVTGTYTLFPTQPNPTLSPSPGTYNESVTVSLASSLAGVTIRYTTNNATPDENSPIYAGPLTFTENTLLKIRAFKTDYQPSNTITAVYGVIPTAPTPVLTPGTGTYLDTVNVTGTNAISAQPGAAIRYTTDGTDPTNTSLVWTNNAVQTIAENTTIKLRTYATNYTPSNIVSYTYTIKAKSPIPTPGTGDYIGTLAVTVSTEQTGGTTRYTTDGTDPGLLSPTWSNVTIASSRIYKLRTYKANMEPSDIVQVNYNIIQTKVATPVISPNPGVVALGTNVTITCATPDAIIRYTMDGTEPSGTSSIYGPPIDITGSVTIKTKAFKQFWTPSDTTTATYTTQRELVAQPEIIPGLQIISGSQTQVRFHCATGHPMRYRFSPEFTLGSQPGPFSEWQEYTNNLVTIAVVETNQVMERIVEVEAYSNTTDSTAKITPGFRFNVTSCSVSTPNFSGFNQIGYAGLVPEKWSNANPLNWKTVDTDAITYGSKWYGTGVTMRMPENYKIAARVLNSQISCGKIELVIQAYIVEGNYNSTTATQQNSNCLGINGRGEMQWYVTVGRNGYVSVSQNNQAFGGQYGSAKFDTATFQNQTLAAKPPIINGRICPGMPNCVFDSIEEMESPYGVPLHDELFAAERAGVTNANSSNAGFSGVQNSGSYTRDIISALKQHSAGNSVNWLAIIPQCAETVPQVEGLGTGGSGSGDNTSPFYDPSPTIPDIDNNDSDGDGIPNWLDPNHSTITPDVVKPNFASVWSKWNQKLIPTTSVDADQLAATPISGAWTFEAMGTVHNVPYSFAFETWGSEAYTAIVSAAYIVRTILLVYLAWDVFTSVMQILSGTA